MELSAEQREHFERLARHPSMFEPMPQLHGEAAHRRPFRINGMPAIALITSTDTIEKEAA